MANQKTGEISLSQLREQLENRIQTNQAAVKEDQRKLALLDGLILEFTGRQKVLDLLASNTVEVVGSSKPNATMGYADMRMVDAILEVLKRESGNPLTIRAVAERLVQGGYRPEGKHFLVTVRNALKRFALREDSKVFETKDSGQVAFFMKGD